MPWVSAVRPILMSAVTMQNIDTALSWAKFMPVNFKITTSRYYIFKNKGFIVTALNNRSTNIRLNRGCGQ